MASNSNKSRRYSPVGAPSSSVQDSTPLLRGIVSWIQRELQKIRVAFNTVHDHDVLIVEPAKPKDGMLRFAEGTPGWDPGLGRGPYWYDATAPQWVKMAGVGSSSGEANIGFDDLNDVTITSATNGELPTYNAVTGTWINNKRIVTEQVTLTVGVGKDYEDINDALKYAADSICFGSGSIKIVLDPGTHKVSGQAGYFTNNSFDGWQYYVFQNVSVWLIGSTTTKANHVVTIDGADTTFTGSEYPSVISMGAGAYITTQYITFDMSADSHPFSSNIWGIVAGWAGGILRSFFCDYKNGGLAAAAYDGSSMYISSGTISGFSWWALEPIRMGFMYLYNITFSGNAQDISAYDHGRVRLSSCTGYTPTTTTNELQPDGTLIMDGVGPITLSGFTLNDVTDVGITGVTDNELLAYDSGSGDWINQTHAEAGVSSVGHTHTIANITDLVLTTPADNELLAYDSTSGNVINQTPREAEIISEKDHWMLTVGGY